MVLNYVSGYKLELLGVPEQNFVPSQYRLQPKHKSVLQLQISDLLTRGVVDEVFDIQDAFISNVFLREKSNGKFRMIVDLSELNEFVEKTHFKMDNLSSALDLSYEGAFLTSVDLKDAYHSVPIWENHKKYLTFQWNDRYFRFNVLPFGLTSAPRVFTKLMKPLFSTLRSQGVSCLSYIDDCLVVADSFELAQNHTKEMCSMLTDAGFSLNFEKSSLLPSNSLVFLGYILDTVTMTVKPTGGKIDKTLKKMDHLLEGSSFTIREVAQVIGTLVDLGKGVEYRPAHYRMLELDKLWALRRAGLKGFEANMSISKRARRELKWWKRNLASGSKKIRTSSPTVSLVTDASEAGWGAVTQSDSAGGRWDLDELNSHINVLELKAILLGLKTFFKDSVDLDILVKTDNTTALAYTNKMGGTHSAECNTVALDIWSFCEKRNIWLLATHIPGVENVEADYLSRNFTDDTEWELSEDIFNSICRSCDYPDIDLFASRTNFKVPKFVSWMKDPDSVDTNAFSLHCGMLGLIYAFPPFRLAGRVMQKIKADKASALLVVPDWPGQFWYRHLMNREPGNKMFFKGRNGNLIPAAPHLLDSPIQRVPLVAVRFYNGH